MNEYLVNKADLDAVADAINNLIKSTTPLVFPDDFISKLNSITVVQYTCKIETHYCTKTSHPASVTSLSEFEVTITPSNNYKLPKEIYVSGCEYSWDSTTGVLSIFNVTGNVFVKITCVGIYSVTYKLDGCSLRSGVNDMIPNATAYAYFDIEEGRTYPSTVKITNANLVSWDATTGTLAYNNATGNVTITLYCTPYSFTVNPSDYVSAIGEYTDTIASDETKTISVTAKSGYTLTAYGVNCTATLTQGATTRKYTLTVSGATGPATVSIIGLASS